jgi:short-subunit dehydrogenase
MTHPTKPYALITGASSGIGRATAIAFAQAGYPLALVARDTAKLASVAAEVAAFGVEAQVYPIDLADIDQVKTRVAAIAAACEPLQILVNNAGMGYTGALADMPLSAWQQVLNLNLTSVWQCIQAVLPTMRQQQRGTIINVASIAGYQVFPDWGAYCVSKFGLVALSKTLAAEERDHGIRVVTISPGAVNTPIWDTDTVQSEFDRSQMLTPDLVAQSILYTVQLPERAVVETLTLLPNAGTF